MAWLLIEGCFFRGRLVIEKIGHKRKPAILYHTRNINMSKVCHVHYFSQPVAEKNCTTWNPTEQSIGKFLRAGHF